MFGLVDLLPSLSRKKKASKPASKKPEKTASAKNTPPERPTAPKPLKNKEPAPESTKPVAQQQPRRDSTKEKVAKQVDLTLPDDIERKYDPNTNRFYYLNHKDKTTSWSPPNGNRKINLRFLRTFIRG